jgi:hypothetical protein
MADYSYIRVLAIDAATIDSIAPFPKEFSDSHEFEEFMDDLFPPHIESRSAYCLSGSSRREYFEWAIKHMITAMDKPILQFVCGDDYSFRQIIEEDIEHLIAIKAQQALLQSRLEMDQLIQWIPENLDFLCNTFFEDSVSSAQELKEVVHASPISKNPNSAAHYGDDGDSPSYVFSVLKSLQQIYTYAQENGLSVVYSLIRSADRS